MANLLARADVPVSVREASTGMSRAVPSAADAVAAFAALAPDVFARAAAVDAVAAYPDADVAVLAAAGLLTAPLPRSHGGSSLATEPSAAEPLGALLAAVGDASLTLGRLFEGHCNAILLAARYGGPLADGLLATLAAEAAAGRISGVWNAERDGGLTAVRVAGGWRLAGRKVHCSGAGSIRRPLVTAQPAGVDGPMLFLPDLRQPGVAIDLSVWQAAGMRGTATGTVRFDAIFVAAADAFGAPGDYYRAPHFAGGAWRVLAVQSGGLRRILALHAEALLSRGRDVDPIVRQHFAAAAGDTEAARLLAEAASRRATDPAAAPEAVAAYVDLARGTFETLARAAVTAARRNVGLGAYLGPDPLDRCCRDLETYLCQPMLDASRDNAARHLLARGGRLAQ
jgi:alkylation response protein AidB-like acyl-CoA dehydrogenase